MNHTLRYSIQGALFIATGLVLPMLFHSIGLGPIFLPMFWPMALAGFYLPWPMALATGLLTPVLSSMMTGMPPVPVLWRMMIELAVLTTVTSLFHQKTKLPVLAVTAMALLCALITGFGTAALLAPLLGWPAWLYAFSSVTRSFPGVLSILIMIPLLQKRLSDHIKIEGTVR